MNITLVLGYMAFGGTERQVAHLANGLVAAGHQVDVLLLRYSQGADYAIDPLVNVTSLNFTKSGQRLAAWRQVRQAFRQADVVYSLLDLANVVCALYKPRRCAPLVWGLRASNTPSGWLATSVLGLMRLLQRRASLAIVNAEAVEQHYHRQGLNRIHYQVVPNGVQFPIREQDTKVAALPSPRRKQESRAALLQLFNLPADSTVALILARAAIEKRQDLALPILSAIPNLHVVFCGSGCERLAQRWQDAPGVVIDQALLERCRFVPHQASTTPLLLGADLLLCLSDAEGFPNAVLEAMAHGLPVVSTAAGAIPELLNSTAQSSMQCGWVAPCGDVAALTAAVRECSNSPEVALQRVSNGYRRATQDYTVASMVRDTLLHLQVAADAAS